MARWRPLEEYTPLAQLLVHYMWEQRPPLLPAQFADKVGISRQLVSRMLNQDTSPEPSALLRMARVMQVSSQTLFRAADYTTDADPIYTYDEAWDGVMATIHTDPSIDEDMREHLVPLLQHARDHHRPVTPGPDVSDDNAETRMLPEAVSTDA